MLLGARNQSIDNESLRWVQEFRRKNELNNKELNDEDNSESRFQQAQTEFEQEFTMAMDKAMHNAGHVTGPKANEDHFFFSQEHSSGPDMPPGTVDRGFEGVSRGMGHRPALGRTSASPLSAPTMGNDASPGDFWLNDDPGMVQELSEEDQFLINYFKEHKGICVNSHIDRLPHRIRMALRD